MFPSHGSGKPGFVNCVVHQNSCIIAWSWHYLCASSILTGGTQTNFPFRKLGVIECIFFTKVIAGTYCVVYFKVMLTD